jgi:hypothetical protein
MMRGTTATTGQTSSHSRTTSKGRLLLPASSYITVKNTGTATRIGQPRDYPSVPPSSPLSSRTLGLVYCAIGQPIPPDAWTGHPRPGHPPPFAARGLDTRAARNSVKFGKWLSIRTPARLRPPIPSSSSRSRDTLGQIRQMAYSFRTPARPTPTLPSPPPFAFSRALS